MLEDLRCEDKFEMVYKQTENLTNRVAKSLNGTDFIVKEFKLPRKKPSMRVQALTGESVTGHYLQDDVKSYHRVNTYYRALDKIIGELKERFDKDDQSVLTNLAKVIFDDHPDDESFATVSSYYSLDTSLLEADKHILSKFRADQDQKLNFLDELYSSGINDLMPEMSKAIDIFKCIPATSCSAERSFSSLLRIKTYLRNTMGQERLSSLALINIEREYSNKVYKEDIESIIDVFGRRKGRVQHFF